VSFYLAIDGPDACGKSTRARNLVDALRGQGMPVVHLREPGSTALGERLRSLLLDHETGDLHPLSEALLFSAARQEMLRAEVEPALAAGKIVVVERCFLSTLVYQGHARSDQGAERLLPVLRDLCQEVHASCRPDLVFVLNLSFESSALRLQADQRQDRIEGQGEDYLRRVHEGFARIADLEPWLSGFLGDLLALDAERSAEELDRILISMSLARIQNCEGSDAHRPG
jgi:dTMP kinase